MHHTINQSINQSTRTVVAVIAATAPIRPRPHRGDVFAVVIMIMIMMVMVMAVLVLVLARVAMQPSFLRRRGRHQTHNRR